MKFSGDYVKEKNIIKMSKAKKKKFIYNHVKACKPFDVEELPDIYLNRRLAAPIVKLLLNTKVTPNQVTVVSFVIGVSGALLLSINNISPLYSALLIYLALILDCVDGQLARVRDQESLSGKILDGLVDYLNMISYYIAMIVFTLQNTDKNSLFIFTLAIAAALSNLAHVILYDYYKNIYITFTIKDYSEKIDSINEINNELYDAKKNKELSKVITLTLYKFYLKVQNMFLSSSDKSSASSYGDDFFDEAFAIVYRRYHRKLVRIWSTIGTSSHVTVVFITAIIACYDPRAFIYCFVCYIAIMNPTMIVIFIFQYRNSKITKERIPVSPSSIEKTG